MKVSSVITRLKKRKAIVKDERRVVLYNAMKESLEGYVSTMKEHIDFLRHETDSGCHHAQMLIHQAESFRTHYYKLRLEYEYHYGNIVHYQETVVRYHKWVDHHKVLHTIHQPQDAFTVKAALAQL